MTPENGTFSPRFANSVLSSLPCQSCHIGHFICDSAKAQEPLIGNKGRAFGTRVRRAGRARSLATWRAGRSRGPRYFSREKVLERATRLVSLPGANGNLSKPIVYREPPVLLKRGQLFSYQNASSELRTRTPVWMVTNTRIHVCFGHIASKHRWQRAGKTLVAS